MPPLTVRRRAAPRTAPPPRARAAASGSRERLLAAASAEFAARGFAGANVDRIAHGAGVNKAMIYYHFTSKAALYQEILLDMFHAVATRVRDVAASEASAADKLQRFVAVIADEAQARPHFPPIWFREIADAGVHLGEATLQEMASVVQMLVAIVQEGVSAGRFRRVNPLLLHGGIVAPLLLFFATAPLRQRLGRGQLRAATRISSADVVAYVQRIALGVVEGRL